MNLCESAQWGVSQNRKCRLRFEWQKIEENDRVFVLHLLRENMKCGNGSSLTVFRSFVILEILICLTHLSWNYSVPLHASADIMKIGIRWIIYSRIIHLATLREIRKKKTLNIPGICPDFRWCISSSLAIETMFTHMPISSVITQIHHRQNEENVQWSLLKYELCGYHDNNGVLIRHILVFLIVFTNGEWYIRKIW